MKIQVENPEAPVSPLSLKDRFIEIDKQLGQYEATVAVYESRLKEIPDLLENTSAIAACKRYIAYYRAKIVKLEEESTGLTLDQKSILLARPELHDRSATLISQSELFDSVLMYKSIEPFYINFFRRRFRSEARNIANSVNLLYRIGEQYTNDFDTTVDGKNKFEIIHTQIESEISKLQENFTQIIQNLLIEYDKTSDPTTLKVFDKLKEKLIFTNYNESKYVPEFLDLDGVYLSSFEAIRSRVNRNIDSTDGDHWKRIEINKSRDQIDNIFVPFFTKLLSSHVNYWLGKMFLKNLFSRYNSFRVHDYDISLIEVDGWKTTNNREIFESKLIGKSEDDNNLIGKVIKLYKKFEQFSRISGNINLTTTPNPIFYYLDSTVNDLKKQRERLEKPSSTMRKDFTEPDDHLERMGELLSFLNEINKGLEAQIQDSSQKGIQNIDLNCLNMLKGFEIKDVTSIDLGKRDRRIAYSGVEGLRSEMEKVNYKSVSLHLNSAHQLDEMLKKVSELASILDTHSPINIEIKDGKPLLSMTGYNQLSQILDDESYGEFADRMYSQVNVLAQNSSVISSLWLSFEESNRDFIDLPDSKGSEDKFTYWTSIHDNYDSALDGVLQLSPFTNFRHNWDEGVFENFGRSEQKLVLRPKSLIHDLINNGDFRLAFMERLRDAFKIKTDGKAPGNFEITKFSKTSKEFVAALALYKDLMVLNEADKEKASLEPLADLIELTINIEKQKTQKSVLETEFSQNRDIPIPYLIHTIEDILTR